MAKILKWLSDEVGQLLGQQAPKPQVSKQDLQSFMSQMNPQTKYPANQPAPSPLQVVPGTGLGQIGGARPLGGLQGGFRNPQIMNAGGNGVLQPAPMQAAAGNIDPTAGFTRPGVPLSLPAARPQAQLPIVQQLQDIALKKANGPKGNAPKSGAKTNPTIEGLKTLAGVAGDVAAPAAAGLGDMLTGGTTKLGNLIAYPIIEKQNRDALNRGEISLAQKIELDNQAAEKAGIGLGDSDATVLRKSAGAVAGPTLAALTAGVGNKAFGLSGAGLKSFQLDKLAQTGPALGLGGKVAAGAKIGTGLGAAFGATQTIQRDDMSLGNAALDIAGGAAGGAAIGAGLPVVGAGISKIIKSPILKGEDGFIAGPGGRDFKTANTFTGKDGKARYEVSDKGAKIIATKPHENTKLSEVLDHPALYDQYPELKDLPVQFRAMSPGNKGQFDGKNLILNSETYSKSLTDPKMRETMIHEIQHAIQQKEGFAPGGSPELFYREFIDKQNAYTKQLDGLNKQLNIAARTPNSSDKYQKLLDQRSALTDKMREDGLAYGDIGEAAFNKYRALHGEAEARAVGKRSTLPQDKLDATDPMRKQYTGVAKKDLLIRERGTSIVRAADTEKRKRVQTGDKAVDNNPKTKIVKMSPDEYLQQAYEATDGKLGGNFSEWLNSNRFGKEQAQKYADAMKRGDVFPTPYIDKARGAQDGRNRALAAKLNGERSIDVAVVPELTNAEKVSMYKKELSKTDSSKGYLRMMLQNKLKAAQDALNGEDGYVGIPEKGPKRPTPATPNFDDIPGTKSKTKNRKFIETVKESQHTVKQVADDLESMPYETLPNKVTLKKAVLDINKDPQAALNRVLSPQVRRTADLNAQGLILAETAQKRGDYDLAQQIFKAMAPGNTKEGQTIQILSVWAKTSPEGVVRYAQKVVDDANNIVSANGVPKPKYTLTEAQAKLFRETAEKLKDMPEGRDKLIATQKMLNDIHALIPASFGEKGASALYYAQLLNPKTAIRNIVGNVGFNAAENAKDALGAPLDAIATAVGRAAGKDTKREVYFPDIPLQVKAAAKGAAEAWQEVKAGVNLSGNDGQLQIDGRSPAFTGKVGTFLSKALQAELSVADRAFFKAREAQTLKNLMKGAGTAEPTKEMLETARYDGLVATFQNDSMASGLFQHVKDALNHVGTKDGKFGVGNFVINYPKTPGNLFQQGINYSPAGYVHFVLDVAKPLMGNGFDKKAFIDNFSRATVGTTGLVGTGALLHKMGVITGAPDKDKDVSNLDAQTGLGQYRINLSALKRVALSGLNPEDGKLQEGDNLITYDWFQPAAIGLSMGANIDETSGSDKGTVAKLKGVLGAAGGSIAGGVQTLAEQPLVTGVQKLTGAQAGGDITAGALSIATGVPASFVPTLLNQVNQLFDNTSRSTYDPNVAKQTLNQVQAKLPYFSGKLPATQTTLGEDKQKYQDGSNNAFNVFINPAFASKYMPSEVQSEVQRLNQSTGEADQYPRTIMTGKVKNTDGTPLSPDQFHDLQQLQGQLTSDQYTKLMATPIYQNSDDSTKVNILKNALTYISAAAKQQVLGGDESKLDNAAKALIKGQDLTPHITGDKAQSVSPETSYQLKLDEYNNGVKAGTLTGLAKVKAQQDLGRQFITSKYSKDVNDLYGMSESARQVAIEADPSIAALMPDVEKLSQALYARKYASTDKIAKAKTTAAKKASGTKTSSKASKKLPQLKVARINAKGTSMMKNVKVAKAKKSRVKTQKVTRKLA